MAKCVRCGRGGLGVLHRAIKLKDKNLICFDCYKELGRDPKADMTSAYLLYTWEDLQRPSVGAVIPSEDHTYKLMGTNYENDEGTDIQSILAEVMKEENDEEYEGLTKRDMDEGDQLWQYPVTTVDAALLRTSYEGEDAIKVFLSNGPHIGWIPSGKVAEVITLMNDALDVSVEISGGRYRELDDGKITTGSIPYKCMVIITTRA